MGTPKFSFESFPLRRVIRVEPDAFTEQRVNARDGSTRTVVSDGHMLECGHMIAALDGKGKASAPARRRCTKCPSEPPLSRGR
jgi:hypothetical protein